MMNKMKYLRLLLLHKHCYVVNAVVNYSNITIFFAYRIYVIIIKKYIKEKRTNKETITFMIYNSCINTYHIVVMIVMQLKQLIQLNITYTIKITINIYLALKMTLNYN